MLICFLHSALGFVYTGERWRNEDLPVQCHLNTAYVPEDLAVTDVEQVMIQSMDAWNRAAGIQIFEYAGRIKLESPIADDGWNAISLVPADWSEITLTDSVIQGLTCDWTIDQPAGDPPNCGATRGFLRAFDIVLNAQGYRWTVGAKPGYYDIQSAVTHELGHVLSLGHTDGDARAPDTPTMVARMYPNDIKLRTLESDDIAGIQSIYRIVSGIVRGDACWENAIFIKGDVMVPRGVSVKIASSIPQTSVHFFPASKLIVEGKLTIDSSDEQIQFTGTGESEGGLEIRGKDQAYQITDCVFEGLAVALTVRSAVNAAVKNCEFHGNQVAFRIVGGENIAITESEFYHNPIAIQVVDGQNISIRGVFRENGVGMEIQSSHSVKILNSALDKNRVGVQIFDTDAQIRASKITANTTGVEIHSDQPVRLRHNMIARNEIGVRVVRGTVDMGKIPDDIGNNSLIDNTIWNLALETPADTPIFAQGNRWGNLTLVEIDRTIRDDDEVPDLPGVQFDPALDAAGLKTALFQNFPNPFNSETWIPYQLAEPMPVVIDIYNTQGQFVSHLNRGWQFPGQYIDKHRAAYWDGRNENGELVSSGIYWYQLRTADSQSTQRMVIRK